MEIVINPQDNYSKEMPLLLPLVDGNIFLAWTSKEANDLVKGSHAQLLSCTGESIGNAFPVSSFSNFQEYLVSAKQLAGGEIALCFAVEELPYSNWDIQVQVFSDNGEQLSNRCRVNNYTAGNQVWPRMAPLGNGGFIVFWGSEGQDGSGYGIYGQLFDKNAGKIGQEFRVNTITEGNQYQSSGIISLTDGRFVLCWETHTETSEEVGFYAQEYSRDGAELGDAITITAAPENLRSLTSAAALPDGSFVVTWLANERGRFEGYGRIFLKEGIAKGGPFRLGEISEIAIGYGPIVIPFSRGGFLVYWDGTKGDIWISKLYGQLFDENGTKNGPEFEISDGPIESYVKSFFARGAADDFIIAWTDPRRKQYFAKRFPEAPLHHKLSPFWLLAPHFNDSLNTTRPNLVWEQPDEVTICYPWEVHYQIFIDESADFPSPIIRELDKDTTCVSDALQPGTFYFWKVLAVNLAGDSLWSSNTNAFFVRHDATGIEELQENMPNQIVLYSNFPNPFNAETLIRFGLPTPALVRCVIYDLRGRLVRVLLIESIPAGAHSVRWDCRDANGSTMPSGIYICRIQVQTSDGRSYARSIKMGLVK